MGGLERDAWSGLLEVASNYEGRSCHFCFREKRNKM